MASAIPGREGCFLSRCRVSRDSLSQMLDAAHGKAVAASAAVVGIDVGGIESQVAHIGTARRLGRRRPAVAIRADIRQGSRRLDAEARSWHMKQSLD